MSGVRLPAGGPGNTGTVDMERINNLRRWLPSLAILSAFALLAILTGCRPSSSRTAHRSVNGTAAITCLIDGMPTTRQALARRPIAVMIENAPQARPQSGLDQACVVYEAITEGGITRFLAIYLHQSPEVIGPVRSARPHFIHLAQEYQPAYVHCGESYEALQIFARDTTILDFDQMDRPRQFWRDHSRRAPHNLYTSTDRLRKAMTALGWEWSVDHLPSFAGGRTMRGGAPAQQIDLGFGGVVKYRLQFVYDAQAGGYRRYMDGKLHVDRETGQPLLAKNIIIQRVEAMRFAQNDKGTYDVRVVGSGTGDFITGGRQTPLKWEKYSMYAATSYTDTRGADLPYQPGQTWVELVPADGTVSITDGR